MKKQKESEPTGVVDIELARQRCDQRLRNAKEPSCYLAFANCLLIGKGTSC